MTAFTCPCLVCLYCDVKEADDSPHPEDGLASCHRHGWEEWWVPVGPRATRGEHAQSPEQVDEWDAYDSKVMQTGFEPEGLPWT